MRSRPRVSRTAATALFGILMAPALPRAEPAAPGPCDASLPAASGHPYGYRLRGDRCEGVYAKPVASTSLNVVSVTADFGDYKVDSAEPLTISWALPREPAAPAAEVCGSPATGTSGEVRLRAQSLQPRVYYRMDTVRPSGEAAYAWPKDTLGALEIPRPGLGVLGWTTRVVGGMPRPVYLPLRVRQGSASSTEPATEHRVLVIPGRELEEVYVTLARLGAAGEPDEWLRRGEPLGYGYYPAERPIRIVLSLGGLPGCYRLEVTGNLRGGGTTATALWLYDAWP